MIVSAQPCPTHSPGLSAILPGLEESAEIARQLVRATLNAWQVEHLTDSAVLLVSELVANAVQHTDSRYIEVVISRTGTRLVRIGVVDTASALPEMTRPGADLLTSGRGLLLIDALCERWGTDIYRVGKHVWCELLVDQPHERGSGAGLGKDTVDDLTASSHHVMPEHCQRAPTAQDARQRPGDSPADHARRGCGVAARSRPAASVAWGAGLLVLAQRALPSPKLGLDRFHLRLKRRSPPFTAAPAPPLACPALPASGNSPAPPGTRSPVAVLA
ncbi:ATP-binding protein [Streptomyces griseorubiginosus]|uniref:ATP-binding protein n=1 Tax=Streptomyces griseorubiginosus TaxID=67304 RepID=UPI0036E905DC